MLGCTSLGSAQRDLKRYTSCRYSNFQMVQADRLPGATARAVDTKTGPKSVEVVDGYRVLMTYDETEPFINMKVEQLGVRSFQKDKQTLIENLEKLASSPGMESNVPEHRPMGIFDSYGISRNELTGGVLSIYALFNDEDKTVTTIYFLNAEPGERKFQTADAYREIRDRFLKEYSACLAPTKATKP